MSRITSVILVTILLCTMIPFTASAAATKKIPVVTVSGIDAPVEGGYGDYTVTLGHPTYELVEVNDNEHINGIRWIDEDGNIMVPGIDRFRAGVKYTVAIHLISKYSYEFYPTSCTLDGEEVSWQGDLRIVQLTKTFEPTEDLSDINTITFDYGFDGLKEYTFCENGETVSAPEIIDNGDLVFFDWYNEKEFKNKYNFEAPVYGNKTIYARYVDPADIVSVYMYTTDNDFPYSIEDAVIGDCISVEDPYVEGWFFTEWYSDPDRIWYYDMNQPITGDVHLYARMISYDDVATVYTYMPDEFFYTDAYEVEKGRCVNIPDPELDGMYFAGWYRDKEYTKPFYKTQPITTDIVIYARFVPLSDMHTISLYYEDDTTPVSTFLIEDGHNYFMVKEPSIEGKMFFGLFTNPERTIPFDSFTPIKEDTSIYAKFVNNEDLRYVSICIEGDKPVSKGIVEKGTTYSPYEPSVEGKIFFGWYSDPERLTPFDFSQPIIEDVTIYAKFVAEEDICYVNIYLSGEDEYPIASGMVEKGSTYDIEDPGREDMMFEGWYLDREYTIPFDKNEPVTEEISIYAKFVPMPLLGDANGDGIVNITDATEVQKHIAEITMLTSIGKIAADVNGDGNVNIVDATLIQKYLAGVSVEYPIGQIMA